jgi:hypothetical protein
MKDYQPRPRCGAKTRSGGTCRNGSGARTDTPGSGYCWLHTGATANGRKFAQRVGAEAAAARLGVPVATDAQTALQDALERANGTVAWLLAELHQLDPQDLTWGISERRIRPASEPGGQPSVEVIQSGRLHPLIGLYERTEKHLTQVASEMARLGIEQRRQSLMELLGARLADGLDRALADAGVPLGQRARVLQLLPGALSSTDGGG